MPMASPRKLPADKLMRAIKALGDHGITSGDLLDLIDGVPTSEQLHLRYSWPRRGVFYNHVAVAAALDGQDIPELEVSHDPRHWCITAQVSVFYDGQSVADVMGTDLYRKHMRDSRPLPPRLTRQMAQPGIYALKVPVPGSEFVSQPDQYKLINLMFPGYQPAPLPVLLLATLVHYEATGIAPFSGWCRSDELADEFGVALPSDGKLSLERIPTYADDAYRFAAAAKKLK